MSLPTPDRIQTLATLERATDRFCSLLSGGPDPNANAIGTWSVRDVAVHSGHIFKTLSGLARGGTSPVMDHTSMSATWDAMVREDPEHDLGKIAEDIRASAQSFIGFTSPDTWETVRPWHGQLQIPEYGLAAIMINEAAIHGLDVAKTMNRNWPIAREEALIAIQGLLPVLPHFLRHETAAGMRATYRLKLRGGPTLYLRVEDGELKISEQHRGKVDCAISADPVSYLLVGYGRKSQWGPIATGKITAWGRAPWLSLNFGKLFVTP